MIRWAAKRLSIYLIGSPRFKTVTADRPLLPMLNEASQKIPLRIEKLVMDSSKTEAAVKHIS